MNVVGNFGGITYIKASKKKKKNGQSRAKPKAPWRARTVVNGQRHTRYFRERVDAFNWLEELRAQFCTNKFEIARRAEAMTLAQAITRFHAEVVTSEADSIAKKLKAVGKYGDFLLTLPLAHLLPVHIRQYRDQRVAMPCELKARNNDEQLPPRKASTISRRTVDKEISAISSVIERARIEWGFGTLINPTYGVRFNDKYESAGQRVNDKEFTKLLAEAAKYEENKNSKAEMVIFIQVALLTTTRLSMLAESQRDRIAPNGKTIYLKGSETKSKEAHSIPLFAEVRALLELLPKDSKWLFGAAPSTIGTAFARIKARAGIDRRLHDLRHEGTSRFVEDAHVLGLTDSEIMQITHHKSYAAFKNYLHLKNSQIVDKVDRARRAERSELDVFVEDLVMDGDPASRELAMAIIRKRRAATQKQESNVIEGEVISTPRALEHKGG